MQMNMLSTGSCDKDSSILITPIRVVQVESAARKWHVTCASRGITFTTQFFGTGDDLRWLPVALFPWMRKNMQVYLHHQASTCSKERRWFKIRGNYNYLSSHCSIRGWTAIGPWHHQRGTLTPRHCSIPMRSGSSSSKGTKMRRITEVRSIGVSSSNWTVLSLSLTRSQALF